MLHEVIFWIEWKGKSPDFRTNSSGFSELKPKHSGRNLGLSRGETKSIDMT